MTGASGQLGHDVVKHLITKSHTALTPSHKELDIADCDSTSKYFKDYLPDSVIHCAAWTSVDLAEDNIDRCRAVNVNGTENIVKECKTRNIPLLYVSTDYVFDGSGNKPWTVNDEPSPINAYGLSKYDGEKIVLTHPLHFILRTSWLFGCTGNNFVKTIIEKTNTTDALRVVSDQIGSPTYSADLAPLILDMVMSDKYGTYHAHNDGFCSWYDVAVEILRAAEIDREIIPISSSQFPTKAVRPLNCRLDVSSLKNNGFYNLPHWKNAIKRFVQTIKT